MALLVASGAGGLWGPSAAQAQALGPAVRAPAEAGSGGAEGARVEEAKQHFKTALDHFEARRYREAIREFRLVQRLMPSAELWFDIARAHEGLGEIDAAQEAYRRYLHERVDPPDRDEVQGRIARLERQRKRRASRASARGDLRVEVDREGALIALNGETIARSPLTEHLLLSPGRYQLDVTASGALPFHAEVEVTAGALTAAYVDMLAERKPPRAERSRVWTWWLAAAAGASLLTSAVLGVAALERQAAADDGARADYALGSDLALAAGLGLGVCAAIAFFVEGSSGVERAVALRGRSQPPVAPAHL